MIVRLGVFACRGPDPGVVRANSTTRPLLVVATAEAAAGQRPRPVIAPAAVEPEPGPAGSSSMTPDAQNRRSSTRVSTTRNVRPVARARLRQASSIRRPRTSHAITSSCGAWNGLLRRSCSSRRTRRPITQTVTGVVVARSLSDEERRTFCFTRLAQGWCVCGWTRHRLLAVTALTMGCAAEGRSVRGVRA